MGFGTVVAVAQSIGSKRNQRKLQRELKNAPKYKITDEAFNNQAIAQSNLYGRDRGIQMAQENVSQSAADASKQARDVTSSSSALLSAIAEINANKNQQLRGLSQDDQMLRQQKTGMLMGANNAMIDEKDKAWNYNQNMPFQMRVAALRDKIKTNQELTMAGISYEGQTASAFASAIGSFAGCDERIKKNITDYPDGLEDVMRMRAVQFKYIPESQYNDGKYHNGFIAQEMREIVPFAVKEIRLTSEEKNPLLIVDFKEIVPVMVKAMQEQQQMIQNLLDRIKSLEAHAIQDEGILSTLRPIGSIAD